MSHLGGIHHVGLRVTDLDEATADTLVHFPQDMARVPAEVNRLNNQVLVQYYESEWRHWN